MRREIAEAQGWRCYYCGCEVFEERGWSDSATLDHVVPRARGGTDARDNLVVACALCNEVKADHDAKTFWSEATGVAVHQQEKDDTHE